MNSALEIFSILLILFVLGLFVFTYFKSQSLHPLEKGLNPLYTTVCSVYLDSFKMIFTRFTIYDDFLVVSSWKKIILRFDEIKGVTQEKIFFQKCLTINHNNKSLPSISLLIRDFDGPKNIIEYKKS